MGGVVPSSGGGVELSGGVETPPAAAFAAAISTGEDEASVFVQPETADAEALPPESARLP